MRFFLLFAVLFFKSPTWSQSFDICDTVLRSANFGCQDRASSNTMGGSYSTIFDAININPASIPIYKTPFGLEYTNTNGKGNFALIKGQNNWGAGFGAKNTDSTFYGPYENYKLAFKQETEGTYKPRAFDPNINLSTAMNLLKIKEIAAPLGLGYKYNPEKQAWSPTVGFGIKTTYLNLGVSAYRENPKKSEDDSFITKEQNDVVSGTIGLKLGNLVMDYTHFNQSTKTSYETVDTTLGTPSTFSSSYNIKTNIYSATYFTRFLSISYAIRKQDDSRAKASGDSNVIEAIDESYKNKHELFGASLRIQDWLNVGYFYNYQLNSDSSLLVQIFF